MVMSGVGQLSVVATSSPPGRSGGRTPSTAQSSPNPDVSAYRGRRIDSRIAPSPSSPRQISSAEKASKADMISQSRGYDTLITRIVVRHRTVRLITAFGGEQHQVADPCPGPQVNGVP